MRPSDVLIIGRRLRIPTRSGGAGGSGLAAGGKGGGHSATTAAVATRAGSATAASDFCETFTPTAGPRRVLPAALAANPGRLALRPLFVRWSEQYGVPAALTEAIAWQESGWQVGAVSSAQAVGVGQLLPTTADFVSHQLIGTNLDITTANDNIRMSARYLAYLQSEEGSICRTVAAYYEGSANMARFGVFPETEPYVASVEALVPRFD
ncbi:MAG: lytic transglycosylase domain-containing protein [Acidimicrobiales bacterium]